MSSIAQLSDADLDMVSGGHSHSHTKTENTANNYGTVTANANGSGVLPLRSAPPPATRLTFDKMERADYLAV